MNMKHTIKFAKWFSRLNSWSSILSISVLTAVLVVAVVLLLGVKRRKYLLSKKQFNKIKFRTRAQKETGVIAHGWHVSDLFSTPTYCNVCETLMVSGVTCVYCNLYVDVKCLKKAEKTFKCKQIYEEKRDDDDHDEPTVRTALLDDDLRRLKQKWHHHWVKGNLKLNNMCFVCKESDCGSEPHLSDYKCCWCMRSVHEACLNSVSTRAIMDECDFGSFRNLILKPNYLHAKSSNSNNFHLLDIKLNLQLLGMRAEYGGCDWTPVVVFANPKSGGNDAEHLVSTFSTILNPVQIVDMNKVDVFNALTWIEANSHLVQFKILVCGGDGSVGWILDEISKLKFKVRFASE
jgi:diacylglycerol kinase (ATP)